MFFVGSASQELGLAYNQEIEAIDGGGGLFVKPLPPIVEPLPLMVDPSPIGSPPIVNLPELLPADQSKDVVPTLTPTPIFIETAAAPPVAVATESTPTPTPTASVSAATPAGVQTFNTVPVLKRRRFQRTPFQYVNAATAVQPTTTATATAPAAAAPAATAATAETASDDENLIFGFEPKTLLIGGGALAVLIAVMSSGKGK